MTTEQAKIDQQVRPLILNVTYAESSYEQARAWLFAKALHKHHYSALSDDEFLDFMNKTILNLPL